MTNELIERAIESAKCRIYWVRANVGQSLAHQMKADNQAEIQQVTIEALEKQKPKKVVNIDDFADYAKCPSCGAIATDNLGCLYRWCRKCGQKLKWGEEE